MIKVAAAADSKALRFFASIPATNPDKTSPVPPTVIAGVFFSLRYVVVPSEIISVAPLSKTVIPLSLAFFSTNAIRSFLESEGAVPNKRLNSPACGVTTTFLSGKRGNTSGTRALASNESRTSLSKRDFIKSIKEPFSCTASPIPIVAESSLRGKTPRSLLTAPRVNF